MHYQKGSTKNKKLMLKKLSRSVSLIAAVFMLGLIAEMSLLPSSASAAQITSRSLTLQAGASDGGSDPGGTVNHFFSFTLPTAGNVVSIQFLYCTLADGSCITPSGLDTTAAT